MTGHCLGVSHHIGDLVTFAIYADDTKRVIHRSVVRPADPHCGGIPNLRVPFEEAEPPDKVELH